MSGAQALRLKQSRQSVPGSLVESLPPDLSALAAFADLPGFGGQSVPHRQLHVVMKTFEARIEPIVDELNLAGLALSFFDDLLREEIEQDFVRDALFLEQRQRLRFDRLEQALIEVLRLRRGHVEARRAAGRHAVGEETRSSGIGAEHRLLIENTRLQRTRVGPGDLPERLKRQRLGLARAHNVGEDHLVARLLGGDVETVDAIVEMIVVSAARDQSRGRRHGGDLRNATPHLTPPEAQISPNALCRGRCVGRWGQFFVNLSCMAPEEMQPPRRPLARAGGGARAHYPRGGERA